MKAWTLLFLLVLAGVAVAAEPKLSPTERPRLTAELRGRVEAASPASIQSDTGAAAANGAVAMTPFWVVGAATPLMRRLEDEAPKNQPFTWEDGGTLLKRTGPQFTSELKFQYDPRHKGIDLLSFSW
jgi:hypothetical protein